MRDMAEVEERLRATFQAVARTTVVDAPNRDDAASPRPGLVTAPAPRRPRRLVPAVATLVTVIAAGAATVVLPERDPNSSSTEIATAPTTTVAVPTAPGATGTDGPAPTCGSQLPRPLDLPEGYIGPERMASSAERQLTVGWTSATGAIVARWPADPQFQELVGQPVGTPDGQPSVSGSGTFDIAPTGPGKYGRTMVFSLRNVPADCGTIQVDVVDADPAGVDAAVARLQNRGLFVSNVPLVVGSEERSAAPTVVGCNAPAGTAAPPKRGGRVSGAAVHTTATDALKAFLEADSSLIRDQYLEVRLPDSSIAYAREQPTRPGSFVTVIHVIPGGGGWSIDRWEASGC